MKLREAALNIATFGYYAQSKLNQTQAELKSLRDASLTGQAFGTAGGFVSIVPTTNQGEVLRKINVNLLRSYAEFSVWCRTAIDIYRDDISKAEWKLEPIDDKLPIDQQVKEDIEQLLKFPNNRGVSYKQLKAQMIEDYLVLGHGALERQNRYDQSPFALFPLNGQYFAFIKNWDGRPNHPRFVELDQSSHVIRELLDRDAIFMLNRPRSYDWLGLSHVEILDRAIRALIDGDEFLFEQVLNGAPNGALFLGQGLTRQQVDEVTSQIRQVKRAFAVVAGTTENAKYVPFNANPDQMKILDTQTWFVRQIASTFKLATAKFGLEVDQSRANNDSMLDNSDEGIMGVLSDVCDVENAQIVNAFGRPEEHNLKLTYPILNARDEQKQAQVSNTRLGGGAFSSINEERKVNGLEPIPLAIADEVMISTSQGPIPLSVLQNTFASNNPQPLPEGKKLYLPAKTKTRA